ncbi:MAG: hypothetical protein LW834_21825 [Cyanobium sp. 49614_E6]|nr:hypothetical protein [Cyanobium sp. 49614_E6]
MMSWGLGVDTRVVTLLVGQGLEAVIGVVAPMARRCHHHQEAVGHGLVVVAGWRLSPARWSW